ncbi:LacI family DNA-binding transcriptional regulator [Leyella stercorea]|uniref:LacI family DNA-binding transcriptional regulator n=1 Tax=Leyella stercorea TaxID=363265 RepID=UPI0035220ECC
MSELQPTTMKDIAEHFGVSIATVSRALNGSARVSEEKRNLICEYAHAHNFYPNDIAKSLRNSHKQPVKVIGVIVPEFTHYYFSTILNGIEDAASKRGYRIIATTSREQYEREVQLCQMFEAHQVCGVIVSQAKETQDYAHLQALIDLGIPLVFYDRICTGVDASRVVVDDYQGAFAAVTHLIETGCRRIAFYGMKGKTALGQNRYNGYHDALLKAGMQPDESLVFVCDKREDAERITPGVLSRADRPDAFFCVNDDTAIGVLYTAKHNGFRVPDDVAVCGFTNGERAIACDPQLTTVEQRGTKVGEEAATILMDKVEGLTPCDRIEKRVVKTRLVVRESTKS